MSRQPAAWDDPEFEEVVERELMLHMSEHRANAETVAALLHPDFLEFGGSGRTWDLADTLEMLAGTQPSVPVRVRTLRPVRMSEDVILLTYTAVKDRRATLRSSLWLRDSTLGWRMRFHQGTPTSDDLEDS